MRKLFGALAAVLAMLTLTPSQAASSKIALLPAVVVKGAAGNSTPVTEALRSSLKKQGFDVLSASQVEQAMRGWSGASSQIVTAAQLADFRARSGADYVVYPRVLSVGMGVNSDEYQANILVNVGGKSKTGFAHTRQVGQIFKSSVKKPEQAVIGRAEADTAVDKLMEQFYAKVH
jgi:hypothetical protein